MFYVNYMPAGHQERVVGWTKSENYNAVSGCSDHENDDEVTVKVTGFADWTPDFILRPIKKAA